MWATKNLLLIARAQELCKLWGALRKARKALSARKGAPAGTAVPRCRGAAVPQALATCHRPKKEGRDARR